MPTQWDSVRASALPNLPTEIIRETGQYLDNQSLLQLASSCRRILDIALDIFFTRNSIRLYSKDSVYLSCTAPFETFQALKMSPWATSLRKLHYVFPGEADKLLKMTAGLHGLVNHLDHIEAANIGFALPLFTMFYGEETSVDKSSWVATFTGLLDALIAMCSVIEISGGEWVQSYYTESLADAEATDVGLQTSELASLPQANTDEEDALVLQDGTHPIQKFQNQLAAFYIKSDMLFHPTFGDWTFSTLHGARATLTVLTLNLDSTLTKTWRSLFTTLDFPMLSKFEIYNINIPRTNGGFVVPSTELLCFLSVHPTIMNLLLHGVENPPEMPPERPAILPNLVSISVDPLWLPTILSNNRVELSDAAANFPDQHHCNVLR